MWETFIIQPMTNVLLWIYDVLVHGPHTFGLAIILFTMLIVALTTYVQSKLTMPASTNPNDQSAAMSGMMSIYMPLLLGWFALNFASGIAVYFIVSNLLGIV